jgi:anti-sigma regulatory factor (Ser/Thr protein kinase)
MQSVVENLNETFEATTAAVARARSQLADFAATVGATDSQTDAVRLAASEAVTNSVLHAYRGEPGPIYVSAALVSGELWIQIADDGCGLKPRADRPGLGLGLGLIAQLSDDFAIVCRASGGTEVRLRIHQPGPTTPEQTGSHDRRRSSDIGSRRHPVSPAAASIA